MIWGVDKCRICFGYFLAVWRACLPFTFSSHFLSAPHLGGRFVSSSVGLRLGFGLGTGLLGLHITSTSTSQHLLGGDYDVSGGG